MSDELNDRITEERGPYWVLISVNPDSEPGELDLKVETQVLNTDSIKSLLKKTLDAL